MNTRLRAALVLLFTFAAGIAAGFFLEHHYRLATLHGRPAEPVADHLEAMEELRTVLELDDEQVERIHAIMADHQQIVDRMWEQLRPEVRSAMRSVHAEIAEVMTPEQRSRFHQWLQEQGATRPGQAPLGH